MNPVVPKPCCSGLRRMVNVRPARKDRAAPHTAPKGAPYEVTVPDRFLELRRNPFPVRRGRAAQAPPGYLMIPLPEANGSTRRDPFRESGAAQAGFRSFAVTVAAVAVNNLLRAQPNESAAPIAQCSAAALWSCPPWCARSLA